MPHFPTVESFVPIALLWILAACGGGGAGSVPVNEAAPSVVSQWDGAYAFSSDVPSAFAVIAQTANANTWLDGLLVTTYPAFARLGTHTFELADSLAQISSISAEQQGVEVVIYDIEHWASTPLAEQQRPIISIAQAAAIAHDAGKRFGIAPDGLFLGIDTGHCTANVSAGIVPLVDWTKIDVVNVQAQELADTSNCKTIQNYTAFVTRVASTARSQNPNIVIIAQVSLRDSDPARALQAATSVFGIANVIYVAYPAPCSTYCTITNLTTLLTSLGG
jgi:hypothetical protein